MVRKMNEAIDETNEIVLRGLANVSKIKNVPISEVSKMGGELIFMGYKANELIRKIYEGLPDRFAQKLI